MAPLRQGCSAWLRRAGVTLTTAEPGLALHLQEDLSKLPIGTEGIHMLLIWGAYDLLLRCPTRTTTPMEMLL